MESTNPGLNPQRETSKIPQNFLAARRSMANRQASRSVGGACRMQRLRNYEGRRHELRELLRVASTESHLLGIQESGRASNMELQRWGA